MDDKDKKDNNLYNHTGNAEKFKGALDKDAQIYQQERKGGWSEFKELHGKEKRTFFVDYYLRYVLIAAAIVAVLIWFIATQLTAKNYVLNILVIDGNGEVESAVEESWFEDFLEKNDYNTKKDEVNINSSIYPSSDNPQYSMNAVQLITTRYAAKDVDLCFSDEDYFITMAENGLLSDLRDYLTPEEFEALPEDAVVYAAIVEEESEEETQAAATAQDASAGEEIPFGIRLDASSGILGQIQWYTADQKPVVGISSVIQNEDLALAFLKDLMP